MGRWLTFHKPLSDDLPLNEFQERYAFLGLPPAPQLSLEQDKQRFICVFNLYRLLRSSLVAICMVIIWICLTFTLNLNLKLPISVNKFFDIIPMIYVINKYLQSNNIDTTASTSHQLAENTITIVNLIWLIWIVLRAFAEFRRTDSFRWKMPISIFLFASIVRWWATLKGPNSR